MVRWGNLQGWKISSFASELSLLAYLPLKKDGLCRMSEEKRKEFRNEVLAAEFGDLLEWRDKLYKDHFPQA